MTIQSLSLPHASTGPASGARPVAAIARHVPSATSVPGDATSRALRAAASRILDAEGIGALSLRRVAKEAGVTTMGIYSRFGGKDGLLDALCLEGFERLEAACRAVPATHDARSDLRALAHVHHDLAIGHPALYRVMYGRPGGFQRSAASEELAAEVFTMLRAAVARCLDDGVLVGDREAIADAIFALGHGHASAEVAGHPRAATPERLDAALRALLRGFAAA